MNHELDQRIGVRLTRTQARKLTAMEQATRRNRSEIIRLLIDAALTDSRPDVWLDKTQLEGGTTYGTER